ncbi:MAG TPA: alpha/beta fold hydrolase [Burkholderiales bacterium]|jgi:predicted alpha/beta-fold hydrolase|nr:alpha/beta fold hydrolase [Burkholderiales bacterium]
MVAYRAPFWLPGGHAQTIYAARFAPRAVVRYRRERWETPDGDFIELDWAVDLDRGQTTFSPSQVQAPARQGKRGLSPLVPLVALFHGLEGDSGSHYALALMAEVARRGWRGVVAHFRGCSGEENRLPRAYHSGDTAEADWILRRLAASLAGAPLYAAGVSLGGNVLLKWLGETGASGPAVVRRAASVSAPVDLMAAGDALDHGINLMYRRNFLVTMRRKALAKLRGYPGLYDAARVRAASTLREFDDIVTAPLHGFADANDYWTRASSKPWLRHIAVPTLMINARNDPFLPAAAMPGPAEVAPAVVLEQPATGGHVGFVSGPFPGNLGWLPRRILDFFGAPPGIPDR